MSNNIDLYYQKKRTQAQYSYTPVGYPDINRLIKSQPYWRLNRSILEDTKKTLILADWSFSSWSYSKTQAIKLKLNELLETGFEIYIWRDNTFTPLTKETIHTIKAGSMKAIPSDEVMTLAVEQKKLLKPATCILDDYRLNCLLEPKTAEEPRKIYNSQFIANKTAEEIVHALARANPQIEQLVLNEFSLTTNRLTAKIRQNLPHLVTTNNYRSLQLGSDAAAELLKNGRLVLDDLIFEINDLTDVDTLGFSSSFVTADELNQLLSKPKALTELSFVACRHFVDGKILPQTFPKLEKLDLHSCVVSNENLGALLTGATNLKELFLSCRGLSSTPAIKVHFPEIEKIDFMNMNLEAFSLKELLSSKKLTSLIFINCKLPQDELEEGEDAVELAALRKLDCQRSNLSAHNLLQILMNAPNLETLKFSNSLQSADAFLMLPIYANLKSLALNRSEITSAQFQVLLSKIPNLKTLKLNSCTNLTEDFNELNCSNLESLTIDGSLPPANLQKLFSVTTKLKNLSCDLCEANWESLIDSLNLESIETISFRQCNIDCKNLKRLIQSAPRLNKMDFSNCSELVIDAELEQLLKSRQLAHYASEQGVSNHIPFEEDNKKTIHQEPLNNKIDTVEKVDADTRINPDKKFNVKRIFYPIDANDSLPPVNYDRLKVFNGVRITSSPCTLEDAFTLTKEGSAELVAVELQACNDDVFAIGESLKKNENFRRYYAKQELLLNQEWQALASLSPNEKMTHYHIEPDTLGVEIQYSLRDNQYYIRSKKGTQEVSIDFLLKVPNQTTTLPVAINEMIARYNHFSAGALKKDKENPNGYDYLRYIQEQEKGACRHRAIAFKDWMEKNYPNNPVRIMNNTCHSYVEIYHDDQWVGCDLGGYPAELILDETTKPQAIKRNPFISWLETWSKRRLNFVSIEHYCQHLLQKNDSKKQLIELSNDNDVNALQLVLQNYCQHVSKPVYYINSPDDLVCSAPFIERKGTQGIICQGPGGPLYDFLEAHRHTAEAPVLIINYAHFSADDIVRFNGLLDDIRHADGTLLPESTSIIGLTNPHKPQSYQGEDFYSRFDDVQTFPLASVLLQDSAPSLAVLESAQNSGPSFPLNLYHASDWEERLLGRWVLHKDNLYFEEGELANALKSGLPIELQNAPWEDERFVQFWLSAQIHKKVHQLGQTIEIPANLQLLKSEGYDWSALGQQVTMRAGCSPNAKVLNSTCFSEFFNCYQCDNTNNTLDQTPGVIECFSHKELEVNVTSPLSDDEWAMLLSACQKHQVKLTCHIAAGVSVPSLLKYKVPSGEMPISKLWMGELDSTMVIASNEVNVTVKKLTKNDLDWQVIDVTECQSADLLVAIEGKFNTEKLKFEFNQSEKALLTALATKKKVILKGKFSKELGDSLASLLLARKTTKEPEGQLILVSEDTSAFNYFDPLRDDVSIKDIDDCLSQEFPRELLNCLTKEQWEQESLNQLKARLYFFQDHPERSSDDAWQGMHDLPIAIRFTDFNAMNSKEKADIFTAQRLEAVNRILKRSPYAFLTGLTAVGKSTFVEKYLHDKNNTLYQGESQILAWAQDSSNARKILFIDEANIESRQWSEFEGLFNKPPGILINGKYYPLTDKHKVIFAGNPLNYGGERQLAPFFAQHGNAVLFEPMPQEFIYEEIIKPIFIGTNIENQTLSIAEPLLKVYRFLCEHSKDEVLISPREIQMMALLALSAYEQGVNADLESLAKHYAYQLGKTLVPSMLEKKFKEQFESVASLNSIFVEEERTTDFLIAPSRQEIHRQLDELLQLRMLRQTTTNKAQKYGGINGIVLEGEPGIGKSEMVIATLIAHGYKEAVLLDKKSEVLESITKPQKIFYRMPVSMQYEDKKRLLLKAFDEGAVVIIDEINSSPMMERLLNDLLMGKTPEGKSPMHPGFLLIGTQNPITMAGRLAMGNALGRRLIKAILNPYTPKEMQEILHKKGIAPEVAMEMVDAYTVCSTKAKTNNFNPSPTFRDLLRVAKYYLSSLFKKMEKAEITREQDTERISKEHPLTKQFQRYNKVCEKCDSNLEKANILLKDYVSPRIFSGSWKKLYSQEIGAIVKKINKGEIQTVVELLTQLQKINVAEKDPLAKRIQFIHEVLLPSEVKQVIEVSESNERENQNLINPSVAQF
ncbi:DUF5617 domain-containing protein [Legionella cardiaca]|uniref:DUF5617 domain-containing protein n=1 Tax=Legionella cardiaca TaxID=1071983 RepID=A0ABY8AU24_9GAMM|nr:DUF5617 domain-containing protein [Legionella cardiaca]WED44179.1 DUF5617 domain-containing protein [Legionella cardiaca]